MTSKRKFRRGKHLQGMPRAYSSLIPFVAAGLLTCNGNVEAGQPFAAWVQQVRAGMTPNTLPVPSINFVYSGSGHINPNTPSNVMEVVQDSSLLGLNWKSMNLGGNAHLIYTQKYNTDTVVNRIWDNAPTVILGSIEAKGNVYMINQNGILFGAGSQVNVGSLTASALHISDAQIANGLNKPGDKMTFSWDGSAITRDPDGNPIAAATPETSIVQVEATARLNVTGPDGKVILLAPASVENLGSITSNGDNAAHAILASGGTVVLAVPNNSNMGPLLVEVKGDAKNALGNAITVNGSVTNQGEFRMDGPANATDPTKSANGSVTLAALAVNQQGSVNATQAINLNGQTLLVAGNYAAANAPTGAGPQLNLNLSADKAVVGMQAQHSQPLTVNVNQAASTQQIEWTSGLNIAETETYNFQHTQNDKPNTSAVVINRIQDAAQTVVKGSINAPGGVYMINQNGIAFADGSAATGAKVNVGGLVASALNATDAQIAAGLAKAGDKISFSWDGSAAPKNPNGDPLFALNPNASVTVSKNTQINITGPEGKAILLAPGTVENLGSISSNGDNAAHAVLAAGGTVTLSVVATDASKGPLQVDVKNDAKDALGNGIVLAGGSVTNGDTSGTGLGKFKMDGTVAVYDESGKQIDTMRVDGSVTMAAATVNQRGSVDASQAINLNGQKLVVAGNYAAANAAKYATKLIPDTGPQLNLNLTSDTATIDLQSPQHSQPLTINIAQAASKQQIQWINGFNIAAGETFNFVQPDKGAIVYNIIYDLDFTGSSGNLAIQAVSPSNASRSFIDGNLFGNGQVVLINEKGFTFGDNAQVLAGSFVASALGITQTAVDSGLLQMGTVTDAAFSMFKTDLTTTDANLAADSKVLLDAFRQATVDVSGNATIKTLEGGYAMLIGSSVNQGGTISTPGGQTVLAAGSKVYLKAPYIKSLVGVSAEVDPLYVRYGTNDKFALSRGADANRIVNSGLIAAALGNITLVGHQIDQLGTLLASTSVDHNGSIRLLARDTVGGSFERYYNANGDILPSDKGDQRDNEQDPELFIVGQQGGKLTFGGGSQTLVTLDSRNCALCVRDASDGNYYRVDAKGNFDLDAQGNRIAVAEALSAGDARFTPSSVEGAASSINVKGGASIAAAGGNIVLSAYGHVAGSDPQTPEAPDFYRERAFSFDPTGTLNQSSATPVAGVGIFIDDGAKLSTAGAVAQRQVADLFVKAELRGNELADNPVQRDGVLKGQAVYVDVRDKAAIANLDGYFNAVAKSVDERAAAGGNITLRSSDSVVVKQGAVVDISGGRVNYAAGTVQETLLIGQNGVGYRVNDAAADLSVAKLATFAHKELAYAEGKSAGALEISAHNIALDGTVLAKTSPGALQRNVGDPAKDRYALPKGGKLIIRDAGQHYQPASQSEADKAVAYGQAQVVFVNGPANMAAGMQYLDNNGNPAFAAGAKLQLSQSLVDNGVTRFDVKSDGRIDIPDGVKLKLGPGGEFIASGRQIDVGGQIIAPNGTISLTTRDMTTSKEGQQLGGDDGKYASVTLHNSAVLSTAGRWVNDFVDPYMSGALAYKGGTVDVVSAYDLEIVKGAVIDVSGGGWVNGKGKLTGGDAGAITLKTGTFGLTTPGTAWSSRLIMDGVPEKNTEGSLRGYSLTKGGSLNIETAKIAFNKDATSASVGAAFDAEFINRGGFFTQSYTGHDGLAIAAETQLIAKPVSLTMLGAGNYRTRASADSMDGIARKAVLDWQQRPGVSSLTFTTTGVERGDLVVGEGSAIKVDPMGAIALQSTRQLTMLGTLEALAGNIRLARRVNAGASSLPGRTDEGEAFLYSEDRQSQSIFLGEHSQINAAGIARLDATTVDLLAGGQSEALLRSTGRYRGQVLDGGTVDIDAGLGYLITEAGSKIDVHGVNAQFNVLVGKDTTNAVVGSNGGVVALAARDGMFLDGSLDAKGGAKAMGGVFSLTFGDQERYSWDDSAPGSVKGARTLTLLDSTGGTHANEWTVSSKDYLSGDATLTSAGNNGIARLDVAQLKDAGFASWYLKSSDVINFEGTVKAVVPNQIRLDSRKFSADAGANVTVAATAVQIGNYGNAAAQAAAHNADVVAGDAIFTTLNLNINPLTNKAEDTSVQDLALVGNFGWSGFSKSTFASNGDIHFDGQSSTIDRNGQTKFLTIPDPTDPTDISKAKIVANPDFIDRLFNGQLKASGDVNFAAAQLYPSTYTDFKVDLGGQGTIDISRRGTAYDILSALGRLEFNALNIKQSGTVLAPLGEIAFKAPAVGGSVTLAEGSLTSVAESRLVPFGETISSGRDWQYTSYRLGGNGEMGSGVTDVSGTVNLFDKAVRVDSADSNVEGKVDLSGGGDVFAYEFVSGRGGSIDKLAASTDKDPTVFAILPDWNGRFAPADSQMQAYYNVSKAAYGYRQIPSLKPGDQISLDNVPGLSGGTYTLLPARYALLAGAYLVSVKPGSATPTSVVRQMDGSVVTTGTRYAATADGLVAYNGQPLTVEVAGQGVVAKRAQYTQTTGTDFFFDTAPRLAGDAGLLSVIAHDNLVFAPEISASRIDKILASNNRNRDGIGAGVDLAAKQLVVTDAGTATAYDTNAWTVLNKDALNALGVSSLMLGGTRSIAADGKTAIDVVASNTVIDTTGSTANLERDALQAPELLFVAKEDVNITATSIVAASDASAAPSAYAIDGNSGFVRVAGGGQATLSRTGVVHQTDPTQPQPPSGKVTVAGKATVTGRALIFDATGDNKLGTSRTVVDPATNLPTTTFEAADIRLVNANEWRSTDRPTGGALTLGASRINVGDAVPGTATGLTVSNEMLAQLGRPDQIGLSSYNTLDMYGSATLGSADLKSLTINSAGITGYSSGDKLLTAQNVKLTNTHVTDATTAADMQTRQAPVDAVGAGKLTVDATDTLTLGGNAGKAMRAADAAGFVIGGFNEVNLKAGKDMVHAGNGIVAVNTSTPAGAPTAAVNVTAGRVVAATNADSVLRANAALKFNAPKDPVTQQDLVNTTALVDLGGKLEWRAKSLDINGRIEAPSGTIVLRADGTAAGDNVVINKGAEVLAEGSTIAFADTAAYAPGGAITLQADTGNVKVVAETDASRRQTRVSVSGDKSTGEKGGDAGMLTLIANAGTLDIDPGVLFGAAGTGTVGATGGDLRIDTSGALTVAATGGQTQYLLDRMVTAINKGFDRSWDVRVRNDNIMLSSGTTVRAQQVSLAADKGNVDIYGTVDASGAKGGRIEIYANRDGGVGGAVNLRAGSLLKANATTTGSVNSAAQTGEGGTVIIGVSGTTEADEAGTSLNFEAAAGGKNAAGIDVSKMGNGASDGTVIFRAPRKTDVDANWYDLAGTARTRIDVTKVFDATGSASAYTISTAATGYVANMVVAFKIPTTNTGSGAVTLNINGKGAKSILSANGTALTASSLVANQLAVVVYDGSNFRLVSAGVTDSTAAGTGAGNQYTVVNTPNAAGKITPGMVVTFRANNASGTAPVLRFGTAANALKADLKRADGSSLAVGEIVKDQLVTAVYDSTTNQFRVVKDMELLVNLAGASSLSAGTAGTTLAGTISTGARSVLEGTRVIRKSGDYVLDAGQQAVLAAETRQNTVTALPVMPAGMSYRSGLEIRTTGNLTVTNDWDLGTLRPAGQPGLLTLRANGDLTVKGVISDGFTFNNTALLTSVALATDPDARLMASGDSWAYRFVAGADAKAANPMATVAGTGTFTLASGKFIRTGTGNIDIAAGKDVVTSSRLVVKAGASSAEDHREYSAIYTVGKRDPDPVANFVPAGSTDNSKTSARNYFTLDGGDITVIAGGSIMGAVTTVDTAGNEFPTVNKPLELPVSDWLTRYSASYNDIQWWGRIGSFRQGYAAFGGGDISLNAGASVSNVTVAIPTNVRVPGLDGLALPDSAVINGGGDVNVRAGTDISGGQYYAESGTIDLRAGGRILGDTQLAFGNTQLKVSAKDGVALGQVWMPMLDFDKPRDSNGALLNAVGAQQFMVNTAGASTRLDVTALNGDIALTQTATDGSFAAPSQVKVAALGGSIGGEVQQMPGANGQLDLLAADSINIADGGIYQYDVAIGKYATLGNPIKANDERVTKAFRVNDPNLQHPETPWHDENDAPSRLIAKTGNITGPGVTSAFGDFNEPVILQAGGDITNPSITVQHSYASNVSRVQAGGDIRFDTRNGGVGGDPNPAGIFVGGAGRVDVLAGGDIDLGNSHGVVTRGNVGNRYLKEQGADVVMMAGIKSPDYAGLVDFLSFDPVKNADFIAGLGNLVLPYIEHPSADPAALLVQYKAVLKDPALVPESQRPAFLQARDAFLQANSHMLRDRFFAALRAAGQEALEHPLGARDTYYQKGRDVIAALFPQGSYGVGNIDMFASQVKTEQGGRVEMFTPGGSIAVGIANPSADVKKAASEQGLFTIRGGEIDAYVAKDFQVNQSRVFTLDGGDIQVWANTGNIDAGNGAKTVSSTPPPNLVVRNGVVELDVSGSISGSGMGTLKSRVTTPKADLYLYAPNGIIDAGDAGLRSSGQVFLGAQTILNASNIQAAGGVTGAPAAAPSVPVSAPSNPANNAQAGDAAATGAATAAGNKQAGLLTVEVLDAEPGQGAASSVTPARGGRERDKKE